MIAYLIGGPQDMVKTLVSDTDFKRRYLKFAHAKIEVAQATWEALVERTSFGGEVVVQEALYVKVYETHYYREPIAIYVYSPDGLVP